MKRAIERNGFCLMLALALAWRGGDRAGRQSAGASDAGSRRAAAPEQQKNGTGVVPPGVKLAPEMPAPGAPKAFHFPQAATKTLPNGLRVFVVSDHEPAGDRGAAGDSDRGQHQGSRGACRAWRK